MANRIFVTRGDSIEIYENNLVTLTLADGTKFEPLEPRRLFPVSRASEYITLLDEEGAEIYLDLFCKKSDTDKEYVKKWMPIVAAFRSVKGNEKEREFLMKWASVAGYR